MGHGLSSAATEGPRAAGLRAEFRRAFRCADSRRLPSWRAPMTAPVNAANRRLSAGGVTRATVGALCQKPLDKFARKQQ